MPFILTMGFFFLFSIRLVFLSFVWLCLGVPAEREVCAVMWSYCGSAVVSLALGFSSLLSSALLHWCHNQCATLHFSVSPPHPFALLPCPHQSCRRTSLIVALIKGKYLRRLHVRHSRIFIRLSTTITDMKVA